MEDGGDLLEKVVYDRDENRSHKYWSPDQKQSMKTHKEFQVEKLLENSEDELFNDENKKKIKSLKLSQS